MVASNVYAVLLSLHAPRMVRTGISESSKE